MWVFAAVPVWRVHLYVRGVAIVRDSKTCLASISTNTVIYLNFKFSRRVVADDMGHIVVV